MKIAPVHPDCEFSFWLRSLMGSAGGASIAYTHSGCPGGSGLVNHGLDCLAITSCSPEQSVVFLPEVVLPFSRLAFDHATTVSFL